MRNTAAYHVYLVYSGATAFLFALIFTIMAVYRVEVAGLNPLQLVLVGTALEITYFLFNVPTGVVADTYSRKLSVIIGVVLFALGFLLEGTTPVFAAILVAQVIEGIAYTFVEGALEAWITDEVGEEHASRAFLRGSQVGGSAGFVGIFASVGLASIGLALPVVIGGVLFAILAVYLVVAMREPSFQPPPREQRSGLAARLRGSIQDMGQTVREGARVVRQRPLALTILGVTFISGGFSEGWDRLWEVHFLRSIGLPQIGALDPVVWFGIIRAGATLLSVAAAGIARRRLALERPGTAVRALLAFNALLVASVIVFALAGNFALALGAYWVAATMRALEGPVYTAWLNQGLDARLRATVLSMSAQANALGQFTVGPAVGAIGTAFSVRAALAVAGVVLAPVLPLFHRATRRCAGTLVEPARPTAVEP